MDIRPVGIYDSGLGGLTAHRAFRALLPGEDIYYFGDTGRVPYGNRSSATIIKYARQALTFLRSRQVKAVLIACGTVSAAALPILQTEEDLALMGVVKPAASKAMAVTRNEHIGVIATSASIDSGVYARHLAGMQVYSAACPLLVPLVENGRVHPKDTVVRTIVEEYTAPLLRRGIDTLILGCTHYPLLTPVFEQITGGGVTLIDAGYEAAQAFATMLAQKDLLGTIGGKPGREHFYISDNVRGFADMASLFLGREIAPDVEMVDIDSFAW